MQIEHNVRGTEREDHRLQVLRPTGHPRLLGADDLEVLVDEDVVRPVDADVVNLVLAVAQLHNTVDDAPRQAASAASVALFAVVPLTIVPDP